MRHEVVSIDPPRARCVDFRGIYSIGGVKKDTLLKQAKKVSDFDEAAKPLLHQLILSRRNQVRTVVTVVCTVSDLGYAQSVTTTNLFKPKNLAQASEQAIWVPQGWVIGLLPGEIVLHAHLKEGSAWVAMVPIAGNIFCIERQESGRQMITAGPISPGCRWSPHARFMFGLYPRRA